MVRLKRVWGGGSSIWNLQKSVLVHIAFYFGGSASFMYQKLGEVFFFQVFGSNTTYCTVVS